MRLLRLCQRTLTSHNNQCIKPQRLLAPERNECSINIFFALTPMNLNTIDSSIHHSSSVRIFVLTPEFHLCEDSGGI